MSDTVLGWGKTGLRKRCQQLKATLLEAGLASPVELAAYWPGGPENQEPSPGDWIYCYANLTRMLGATLERREDPARRARAEAAVLAALRGAPVSVPLVDPAPDGEPRSLSVYPKSFHTLCQIEARDRELARLAEVMEQLPALPASAEAEWARPLWEEADYQTRVLIWILTTEGPGLPYPEVEPRPEPPAALTLLTPPDVVAILQAHRTVNGRRLREVSEFLGTGASGPKGRSSWATLAATAASELHVAAGTLLRDWALEAWIAQLGLTNTAKQDAIDQATARAKRSA